MTDEQLTPSFKLSEFTDSETAARFVLDNTPTPQALANIRAILAPGMQRVRDLLGTPIHNSSGYRSPAVNAAVGSGPTSQHLQGLAADFKSPTFGTPLEIAKFLQGLSSVLRFDQLIFEGQWVHISFAPKPRGQVLTAHFRPGKKTTYTPGIA